MGRYKICVYAICKNEAQFVDRWMDSMTEADLVVVLDTGSTDDTADRLRARGAQVTVEEIRPWRFDHARNRSLQLVPDDVDICVCTDLDEVFEPGWRACLEKAWKPHTRSGRYIFNWSLKPDGSPGVQFHYFKVHARHGYEWACPVHEYLRDRTFTPDGVVFIEGMVLNHYPDASKPRSSYLPLLELAVEEDPENERMRYYLGREYMFRSDWQKCIDTLRAFLDLKKATWREERAAAMRHIARAYRMLDNIPAATEWYHRAIAEAGHLREPYVECAQTAYMQKDWPTVFFMTHKALSITERSKTYVNAEHAWDYTPHDLAAIACWQLGMYVRAVDHAQEALRISPGDKRLQNNLALIQASLARQNAAKSEG